jgi:hypothetical protein
MSYGNGFPSTTADRAGLLSGLRGGQHPGLRSTSNPTGMNQSFDELQYMMMQQQIHFQQQAMPFQPQHQPQFQNSAQAQLFALQQSQMELQLQQIKMANLALQEQLLIHHHQSRAQSPPEQIQQQHVSSSYGNLAALGAAAVNRRANGRSVSAGPAFSYMNTQAGVDDAINSWRQNGPVYSSPDTSYEVQPDMGSDVRHEVRRGALQNLQQARQQRSQPPAAPPSSGTISPPTANLDWQAQRMQYKSGMPYSDRSTPEAAVVVTPPAQIDSGKRDLTHGSAAAHLQQHRKNSSEVSDASIQSLSISEAGSHVSPNRGPALVLSKPGDEFPDDAGDESTDDGPMSPSLTASMRAASIHGTLAAATASTADSPHAMQHGEERRSSSGRHTVILNSSIVDLRRAAADGKGGRTSPFTDSDSSSTASSPTSDKSEVASFESTISTAATSLPNTLILRISLPSQTPALVSGDLR